MSCAQIIFEHFIYVLAALGIVFVIALLAAMAGFLFMKARSGE